MATIIFQYCINPLGHGVHQNFTDCTGVLFHSSMKTSQSWCMLETLASFTFCLRMPHRCSMAFILNQIIVSWSHQTTGHGSSNPCPTSACLQQTVCRFSCASSLEEVPLRRADLLNVVSGVWSPPNLCSNAGNTHTSISQTQPLDLMLSTYTQLLWSTMARPVLSGICPVKPLYGFGHGAAAQYQSLAIFL